MSLKPYYQDDNVTIYHGDCRQIVPQLGKFDLMLTDPPYGINMDGGNVGYKGNNNFEKKNWDQSAPNPLLLQGLLLSAKKSIVWGGNYMSLPPTRQWLVWDKGAGFKGRTYAEAELAWTSLDSNVRVLQYDPLAKGDYKGKLHPTQKPLEVFKWCINIANQSDTILDPFAGSGTTGRAAKDLNKKAVLIEKDEDYCKAAATRMAQEVLL